MAFGETEFEVAGVILSLVEEGHMTTSKGELCEASAVQLADALALLTMAAVVHVVLSLPNGVLKTRGRQLGALGRVADRIGHVGVGVFGFKGR